MQLGVGVDDVDEIAAKVDSFVEVGITDFVLIVRAADPGAIAERLADRLPRLRELGS